MRECVCANKAACSPRPLAGRGPRRSAASFRGEGEYPQVRACRESPSPARKMLATSPRKRGEVKNGDAEGAHPHITPTPASASLRPTLPTKGRDKKERASL